MSGGEHKGGGRGGSRRESIRRAVENAQPVRAAAKGKALPGAPKVSGFLMRTDGLYWVPSAEVRPPEKVCGPFEVLAEARGADGSTGWALLLRWLNRDGEPVEWLMPRELIAGDGAEVRRRLASGGLDVSGRDSHRAKIREYLSAVRVDARVRLAPQVGWFQPNGGPPVYVLPDRVVGAAGGEEVRLDMDPLPSIYRARGTLDGWRCEVAARCRKNSRLLFAVSCAFAAPLLPLTNDEGGGINLRGESSKGKTTLIDAAASAWGPPSKTGADAFVRPWRATSNALEFVANSHNHALLPMDEMGQVDPRELGETLYMLANGAGKERARAAGGNRRSVTWLTLVLSSSEESVAAAAQSAGRRVKAGQEVRLLDVPAVVPGAYGCFEALHGEPDGQSFAQRLRRGVTAEHGTAAPAFLEWLAERLATRPDFIAEEIEPRLKSWLWDTVPDGADGQVWRAGRRLALIAAAGELATEAGVTGWRRGEAARAVAQVFKDWLLEWGGVGSREDRQLFAHFQRWVTQHDSSRFATIRERRNDDEGEQNAPPLDDREKVVNRAGWRWQEHDDEGQPFWVYGIATSIFDKEIAEELGMNPQDARARLGKAGLIRGARHSGKLRWSFSPRRIPGAGRPQLVVTDSRALYGADEVDEAAE